MNPRFLFVLLGNAALLQGCVAPRDFNQLAVKTPAYEQVAAQLQAEPAAERVRLEQLQNLIRLTLANATLFPEGGAELGEAGKATLAELAPALKELPGKRIVVVGFTDDVPLGPTLVERLSGNVELSKARSAAVTAFLSAQGVPATLITPVGLGETHPAASNATAEGRAQNQRVDIAIVDAPA
ncbi:MAG TPA: OmpA family protein [Rubrivivax sp.]|nr:OmpA family protein [Rubrivivax sp.]